MILKKFEEFERMCSEVVENRELILLLSPRENKLLRKDFFDSQSEIMDFKHKTLQANIFRMTETILNLEDNTRFSNLVIEQLSLMKSYSAKLNYDIKNAQNSELITDLQTVKATNSLWYEILID
jgi:hypothetical protein